MELKTLTVQEGLLRMLDGEEITALVPTDLGSMTVDDLIDMKDLGAVCIRTGDLPGRPEEPAVSESEADKSKKAKVDTGKIKALADAGWSVQKIADEMGLSWATVKKYLKEGLGE